MSGKWPERCAHETKTGNLQLETRNFLALHVSRLTFDTDAAFYLQATRLSSYGQITIDKC